MSRKKRYLLRDSDRSGFTYNDIELVNDNGSLVGGDEFDAPPPSNRLVPAEGSVSPGDTRQFYMSYTDPTADGFHTQYVTPAGGISLYFEDDNSNFQIRNPVSGWFYILGSNSNVVISKNPQIAAGQHNDKITLECVGSNVVLSNSQGCQLRTPIFNMDSGAQINLVYNATDGLWHESSRGHRVKGFLGAF